MILAIGDSNMYPSCTESNQPIDPTNMVPVFSKQLGQEFHCWSKNGASNYWIEHHLDYFLAQRDPDTFLFVGWTSFEREEWPWLYSNYSVCGGPDFGMPEPMKARFETWKTTLTGEYYRQMTQTWHDRIYQTHMKLRELGVRHLFWTTYNNFHQVTDQQDWHENFFRPYDVNGCMAKFLESIQQSANVDDPWHYDAKAQQAWASALSQHAVEHCL